MNSDHREDCQTGHRYIAADMPLSTSKYPIEPLLQSFQKLCSSVDDVKLLLTGKRDPDEIYSVWNYIDQYQLSNKIEFYPYFERTTDFPVHKSDCEVWLHRSIPHSSMSESMLQARLDGSDADKRPKYALFFTSFHPGKQEGNSTLMRLWLDHLKASGYTVHVVYYMYDINAVDANMRREAYHQYDLYREVPVRSKLVGANYNGLNVHVDDWCGLEALQAVDDLIDQFEYDIAITNYPFMSAVLDRFHAYTKKILLTHDSFVDRNRRMLEQGYPESGWVSLDHRGEQTACRRADVVVAMQELEAEKFRNNSDPDKVVVIGPIFDKIETSQPSQSTKFKIGYFGSSNWVNEQNLGEYLKHWADDQYLYENSEIIIAGGVCETLKDFVPASLLRKINPTMHGRVESPKEFFESCDLIINPERGGTGIKIKSLEALAHGVPIAGTFGAFVGLNSTNQYHAAQDFQHLAQLTKDLVQSPESITELRSYSQEIYNRYCVIQQERMNALLGNPIDRHSELNTDSPAVHNGQPILSKQRKVTVSIPQYVQQTCSSYHIEEFEQFVKRIDIRGKRVLEIGSDFHLASARLFQANGAGSVIATNIANWKSDEPLPDGVEFKVCDASKGIFDEDSFDIIYGIAILEHIPHYKELVKSLSSCLKSDGVMYFQGCPLWTGTLGHHVWYETSDDQNGIIRYSFTENNPIPDWAHLTHTPEELASLLISNGLPSDHADGIVRYIYNLDGTMIGSCSNFLSASEVIQQLQESFEIEVDRIISKRKPNKYFDKASESYSEEDLRTLGLRIWATHANATVRTREQKQKHEFPQVSIIIPFYGVESFIEECIQSVIAQDYPDLEIIFIDDQSRDNSRSIVEKYAAKDDRIKIITHEVNKGLGPARNTGVKHSSGRFIFFLDSDDWMASPSAISHLVSESQSTGCQVVVGSCDRVMTNGQRLAFDRDFDHSHNGTPDQIISGLDAFLGASFIPGGKYVPMRAWGTLIDRYMYDESGLEYPSGEHEDLPHTPFLYKYAGSVLYSSQISVTYRDRSDSISNTGWDAAKIGRQSHIWKKIKENVERYGVQEHLGNCAVKTAEHLIMKLRQNGIEQGSEFAAFDVLEEILTDSNAPLNHDLLFYTLDSLRSILDFKKYDFDLYHKLTKGIPSRDMTAYYKHRLRSEVTQAGSVPIHAVSHQQNKIMLEENRDSTSSMLVEVKPKSPTNTATLNDERCKALESFYLSHAPRVLKKFPSMLTTGDKALYFDAGYTYQFKGSIVDAGCFIGGTTMSLVQGLLKNPLSIQHQDKLKNLIRVYDLFKIDDDYILGHLKKNYPKQHFENQGSFLPVFEHNLRDFHDMLDVYPGDVMASGFNSDQPIEILGVDLCKALPVTDYVVREFFPNLLVGARVIQQDFIHQYHPHIHLSMMKLQDFFDLEYEICWGGSVSYTLNQPITEDIIQERFGTDSSWYNEKTSNISLLQQLESDMLYDQNRWVITQVLAIYQKQMGDHEAASQSITRAQRMCPQFDIPDEVNRLIGTTHVQEMYS